MLIRRAFSLLEVLTVCALIALVASPVFVSAASSIKMYLSPDSDYNVDRSVEDTTAWLDFLIERSLREKRDFVLQLPPTKATSVISAKFFDPLEEVEYSSRNLAYRAKRMGPGVPDNFRYSHLFQTMSPAFELLVHTIDERNNSTMSTNWSIIVSVYGFVRHVKNL